MRHYVALIIWRFYGIFSSLFKGWGKSENVLPPKKKKAPTVKKVVKKKKKKATNKKVK